MEMSVKSLECQLAQAQLGRYVAGDNISDEALAQLEAHIARCLDCKEAAAKRREVLAGVTPTATAVIQAPSTKSAKDNSLIRKLLSVKEAKGSFVKPTILAAGLAGTLLLMGNFANDPSRLFGERASTQPKVVESTPPNSVTASKLPPYRDKSLGGQVAKVPAPTPVKVVKAPTHKPPAKPQPKKAKPAGSGIRVYSPDGNPINGG